MGSAGTRYGTGAPWEQQARGTSHVEGGSKRVAFGVGSVEAKHAASPENAVLRVQVT